MELIQEHSDDEGGLTIYTCEYVDLCHWPTRSVNRPYPDFELLNVAGAYWRGKSENPMMQRVYGTAWFDKKISKHLQNAKKRPKNVTTVNLVRELDLFMISQEVGQGLPFWLPNGATIRRTLERYITEQGIGFRLPTRLYATFGFCRTLQDLRSLGSLFRRHVSNYGHG